MVSRLTTAQIASVFFVPERTMGQRTSRAKATLRAAGVDFRAENLATGERLSAVRHILYLVFNEGYACSSGESLTDVSLAAEVIRLVRQLHQAMPDDTETTPGRAGLSSPSTGSEVLPSDRTGLGSTPPTNRSHGTITVTDESLGSVTAAVLGFAAHFVVCASVEPEWAHARLPAGELSTPLSPLSLMALADRLGTEIGSSDAVFASVATGEASDLMLVPDSSTKQHRVARAHRYREGVRVWVTGDRHGLLVLGRGIAGRWEFSFEVAEPARGRGLGRALANAALGLLPPTPIFAQVAPGNASSMRVIQAAGYQPIGSEVLLTSPVWSE